MMAYLSEHNLFYLGKRGRDVSFSFLSVCVGGGGGVGGRKEEGREGNEDRGEGS